MFFDEPPSSWPPSGEHKNSRVPALVYLCQRVAVAHVDSIKSLGDDIRYSLVKPILERATATKLRLLEHASPHIKSDTSELWLDFCCRKYSTAVERFLLDDAQEPREWRDRYLFLEEDEAKRLDEAGAKLRSQRLEANKRKKEREVKLTDKIPPSKRSSPNGRNVNPQRKSLFQKTWDEASKLQKTMYNTRILPPMPSSKNYRVLPRGYDALLPSIPSTNGSNRVTVNTVMRRRAQSSSQISVQSTSARLASSSAVATVPLTQREQATPSARRSRMIRDGTGSPAVMGSDARLVTVVGTPKRDPMASLFLPKNKAHSQRPCKR